MASTSTEILHNSPALHALKRDQLLSLCRVHGVRASGKNTDIVRRLQQHARNLNYHEDADQDMGAVNPAVPRVSEPWEVVMDTINESDERSQKGTLNSLRTVGGVNVGEFGTSNSNGMGSLKAFASSWGFRRGDTSKMTTTVSSIASSQVNEANSTLGTTIRTQLTALTTPDISPRPMSVDEDDPMATPLPGTSLRPGAPVPSDTARLSLGTGAGGPGPSTTIRLIAPSAPIASSSMYASPPKLRALTPSFNLDLDTSMASPSRMWPKPSQPAESSKHYPDLPTSDDDADMPGAFEGNTSAMKIDATPPTPPKVMPEPFVFGSHNPRHSLSNAGFAAAANDIYAEMNRRLAAQGAATLAVPLPDMLARGKFALANGGMPVSPTSVHPTPAKDRFAQTHQREFEKMESIADVIARRQAANSGVAGRKRKSSVAPAPATNVAPGQRRAVIPGGFFADDDEDMDDEPQNRRLSKRPRVSIKEPAAPQEDESEEEDPREASARLAKEREAIQRKLAASRARRRSSRVSGAHARPRVSVAKSAPKSRFAFLSSAKTLVKNVWNRGAAASAPPVAKHVPATAKPVPAPEPKKLTKPAPASPRPTAALPIRVRPSTVNPSVATSRVEPRKSVAPNVASAPYGSTSSKTTSTSRKSVAPVVPSTRLQVNPPPVATQKRGSSIANNSSRPGHARTSSNDSAATATTIAKRTSTLYAPTAASLARRAGIASRPLPTPPVPSASSKASVIARNAPASAHGVLSPSRTANVRRPAAPTERPTIFGRPFAPAASPTKIPSPARPVGENAPAVEPSAATSPAPPKGVSTLGPRKVLNRPRISRSKVLAKVNAQREAAMAAPKAASGSGVSSITPKSITPGRKNAGRVRSSLSASSAARRSLGAIKAGPRGSSGGSSAVDAVAAAAKRRARQSEYTRRKSTVAARTPGRAANT